MTSITQVIITLGVMTFIMVTTGDIGYNLTIRQQLEQDVLPLCEANTTLGIEGIAKVCHDSYGGPVTNDENGTGN